MRRDAWRSIEILAVSDVVGMRGTLPFILRNYGARNSLHALPRLADAGEAVGAAANGSNTSCGASTMKNQILILAINGAKAKTLTTRGRKGVPDANAFRLGSTFDGHGKHSSDGTPHPKRGTGGRT